MQKYRNGKACGTFGRPRTEKSGSLRKEVKKYARKATVEKNLSVGLRRPKGTQ